MQTVLTLNITPELEDDLVDYLLELECISGFTSWPVRGHGRHGALSLAEQVTGRRLSIRVEILLEEHAVDGVLAGLKENVGHDIAWWQQSVSRSGRS
jgi:nitrogen regulatory protein PII